MLEQLRRDIEDRLNAVLSEAEKLRRALSALGPDGGATSPSRDQSTVSEARGASASRRRTRPGTSDGAAARRGGDGLAASPAVAARGKAGETKNAVLAALSGGSAMTAGEVAAATGLGRASVSTTLSKLAKSGEVTKAARGYQLTEQTPAQPSPSTHRAPDGDAGSARSVAAARRRGPRPSQAAGAAAEPAAERPPRAGRRRSADVSPDRLAAILAGRGEEGLSADALAKQLGVGNRRVLAALGELEAAGRARREGSRRTSRWIAITDEERIAARAAELQARSRPNAPTRDEAAKGSTAASGDRDDGQTQSKAPELT
jgi:biotin operon repressor